MPFELDLIPFQDIRDETLPTGKRFYHTPGGKFPSVTTVIGSYKGDQFIKDWKKRVGEERARQIGGRARVRGKAVHSIAENYFLNKNDWAQGVMPINLDSFLSVKPILDRHVGTVFGIEVPLWSSRLMTAGRTDLLAEWDGVPAIIDFKTSLRVKNEEGIWGYLIQKSCYGEMVEELTDLKVPRIVTVMMVDNDQPIIWVRDKADYVDQMVKVFVDAPRPDELVYREDDFSK